MEKNKVRKLLLLKLFSFLLLPLFVLIVIQNAIVIAYAIRFPEVKTDTQFYDTNLFSSAYEDQVYNTYNRVRYAMRKGYTTTEQGYTGQDNESGMGHIQDGEYTIYYEQNDREQKFKYLVINESTKQAYTNVSQTLNTDTMQEVKDNISQDVKQWKYANGEIQTNIPNLSTENYSYSNLFLSIKERIEDGAIYTSFDETVTSNTTNMDNISFHKEVFHYAHKRYEHSYINLTIAVIGILVTSVYLIISTGYKKDEEGIYLDWFDRLPLEVMGIIALIVLGIETLLVAGAIQMIQMDTSLGIILTALSGYVLGITGIYCLGSGIKRIKAKQLFKNTIIARIFRWIRRKYLSAKKSIQEGTKMSTRLALYMAAFIIISIILIGLSVTIIAIPVLIAFWIWSYFKILNKINEFNRIKDAIKHIYEGNTDIHLNEQELTGVLKELAIYVNDIAGGFSNAIQESLKSERLKTELITNVSHDIKTPLTSIINYVDLLKKENIENETIKEYLDVLDNKSQRLKKLIEDLVEASKASSGNIKLEKEKINIKELMNQISGEFEDKFKEKELEIIASIPEEDIYTMADSKYMYRIIENLYSNISKYALERSRVYVDVIKKSGKILITIKNISKEQLNISTDELMQRFVRGDSSRNTEGSGLGLSIARSLTELQHGKFNIILDGDLFKVVLEFEEISK